MIKASVKVLRRGFVDLPEGSIHYKEAGTGQALLLMHNATGSSVYFADALPFLAKRYRAIAIDLYGHGDSDPPPKDHTNIKDAAHSAVRFLDALDIGRAHVLGLHTGGSVAAEMAILYPERLDRLVIMGSPDWDEERRVEIRQKMDPALTLTMDGSHLLEAWQQQIKAATSLSSVGTIHKATITALQSLWWSRGVHHWVEDQYMRERLPLIKVPTMILSGEHDTMIDYVEPHTALLPEGTPAVASVIKGAGDFAPMEVPEEFSRVVVDFLEKPLD